MGKGKGWEMGAAEDQYKVGWRGGTDGTGGWLTLPSDDAMHLLR